MFIKQKPNSVYLTERNLCIWTWLTFTEININIPKITTPKKVCRSVGSREKLQNDKDGNYFYN